jgi:hypothetical protein
LYDCGFNRQLILNQTVLGAILTAAKECEYVKVCGAASFDSVFIGDERAIDVSLKIIA